MATSIEARSELLNALLRQVMGLTVLRDNLEKAEKPPPKDVLMHVVWSGINLFGATIDMLVEEYNIPEVELDIRIEHVKEAINREIEAKKKLGQLQG